MSGPSYTNEQRQVLETWEQGLAVVAGAGSGKTFTLTQKCMKLLERNPESRFAAITFTEKSASELRERLGLLGCLESAGGTNWVMTIHGFCGAIAREFASEAGLEGGEAVIDGRESALLWEQAVEQILSRWEDPDLGQALARTWTRSGGYDAVFDLLTRGRELELFGAVDLLSQSADQAERDAALLTSAAIRLFEHAKRKRGALDFNDLERFALRALESPEVQREIRRRFDLLLVDEFQDTNPIQSRIVELAARTGFTNLCVVGDPKQSIYRFRDADVTVFDEFCSRLPVRVELSRNFRSAPGILDFVNRVCEPVFAASQLSYQALEPTREVTRQDPVLKIRAQTPAQLAAWIRSEVAGGAKYGDFAILLRRLRSGSPALRGSRHFKGRNSCSRRRRALLV